MSFSNRSGGTLPPSIYSLIGARPKVVKVRPVYVDIPTRYIDCIYTRNMNRIYTDIMIALMLQRPPAFS